MARITRNVEVLTNRPEIFVGGGRRGTVKARESVLVKLFGQPQPVKCFDDKVTKRWVVVTPHGLAEVRDYWWNAEGYWSFGADNAKSSRWALAYLRTLGLDAGKGIH